MKTIYQSENAELLVDEDGVIRYGRRFWVLDVHEISPLLNIFNPSKKH